MLDHVFHHFLLIHAFIISVAHPKKVIHYDHNNKYEEILCWSVKLHDASKPHSSSIVGDFPSGDYLSVLLDATSHFTLEAFPRYFVLCHSENGTDDVNFKGLCRHHRCLKKQQEEDFVRLKKEIESRLSGNDDVEWFSQEVVRHREKRSVKFNDPFYPQQWHLHNWHVPHMDINVTGVWERGITGKGITVAVVDDGVEWRNADLSHNYNLLGSWDLNDNDPDPSPSTAKVTNHHGTRCAGEIAAVANNSVCGVGVAYHAKISGIRVLDGPMTDSLEAAAFNKQLQVNHIYSCSWGPDDDGKTVDGPHIMAAKAMKYGVDFGRNGYGSIYVVASGNGGRHKDNCNYDGYANSIYTLTIGAVDELGQMPFYAEECASMLGVTFSSGRTNTRNIVTTDWTSNGGIGCTQRHTGTSAAAPLAAAMVALVLQARPCLTWRDVQYIIIVSAVKVDVDIAHWQRNGAGLYHSHKHGFGVLKAWRMVNAAKVWRPIPWMTSYAFGKPSIKLEIPKGGGAPLKITHTVTPMDIEGYGLYILENVEVTVTISHPHRGLLNVRLLSPSGTVSVIGAPRPLDNSSFGFRDWTFSTVRCWGEKPTGKWTLLIIDTDKKKYAHGHLLKWQIILFGTPVTSEDFQNRRREIEVAMSGEFLNDNFSLPCTPPPVVAKPDIPMSQKTLKIIVLVCAFCVVMGVYETFEYAFCYNDEKKEHRAKVKLTARAQRLFRQAHSGGGGVVEDPDDTNESTGLLISEDIPMETFSMSQEDSSQVELRSSRESRNSRGESRNSRGESRNSRGKSRNSPRVSKNVGGRRYEILQDSDIFFESDEADEVLFERSLVQNNEPCHDEYHSNHSPMQELQTNASIHSNHINRTERNVGRNQGVGSDHHGNGSDHHGNGSDHHGNGMLQEGDFANGFSILGDSRSAFDIHMDEHDTDGYLPYTNVRASQSVSGIHSNSHDNETNVTELSRSDYRHDNTEHPVDLLSRIRYEMQTSATSVPGNGHGNCYQDNQLRVSCTLQPSDHFHSNSGKSHKSMSSMQMLAESMQMSSNSTCDDVNSRDNFAKFISTEPME